MATKTRILVADNQASQRHAARKLIEAQADMEMAGEAADGFEAPGAARAGKPHIVLLAINMPGPGLETTIEELRRAAPGARVIVFSANEDLTNAQKALQYGAMGYVAKSAAPDELISAIHAVRAGRTFVDSPLSSGSPNALRIALESQHPDVELSDRELQVLRLLAVGHSNLEIATLINLSVKTVETYRHRITVKLVLDTRAELYQFALAHGLLADDEK